MLEESGDIDQQIARQRGQLLRVQLESERVKMDSNVKERLRVAKLELTEQHEETRTRMARESQLKLDREKERMHMKNKTTGS